MLYRIGVKGEVRGRGAIRMLRIGFVIVKQQTSVENYKALCPIA